MANIFTDILDDKVFKVVFGDKLGRNNMINFLRALLPDLGITEIEGSSAIVRGRFVD